MPSFSDAYALLSAQRALSGSVTPELRTLDIKYLSIEHLCEGSAIIPAKADFSPDYVLDGKIQPIVYPNPVPVRGCYAYRGSEPHDRGPWPSNKLSHV